MSESDVLKKIEATVKNDESIREALTRLPDNLASIVNTNATPLFETTSKLLTIMPAVSEGSVEAAAHAEELLEQHRALYEPCIAALEFCKKIKKESQRIFETPISVEETLQRITRGRMLEADEPTVPPETRDQLLKELGQSLSTALTELSAMTLQADSDTYDTELRAAKKALGETHALILHELERLGVPKLPSEVDFETDFELGTTRFGPKR